jgi:hypothetical protein
MGIRTDDFVCDCDLTVASFAPQLQHGPLFGHGRAKLPAFDQPDQGTTPIQGVPKGEET